MAIIGPSGCGKTTLLRLASGILAPDTGEVELDGHRFDRLGADARRRLRLARIGIVFQDFRLLDHLDVIGNVLLPFRLGAGDLNREARAYAAGLLERLGIGHLARRPVTRLSQGERQRTAICRALVTRPGLVLADEPTGNLDGAMAIEVMEILQAINLRGTTVMVATHDTGLMQRFPYRVLRFRAGRLESGGNG